MLMQFHYVFKVRKQCPIKDNIWVFIYRLTDNVSNLYNVVVVPVNTSQEYYVVTPFQPEGGVRDNLRETKWVFYGKI